MLNLDKYLYPENCEVVDLQIHRKTAKTKMAGPIWCIHLLENTNCAIINFQNGFCLHI